MEVNSTADMAISNVLGIVAVWVQNWVSPSQRWRVYWAKRDQCVWNVLGVSPEASKSLKKICFFNDVNNGRYSEMSLGGRITLFLSRGPI